MLDIRSVGATKYVWYHGGFVKITVSRNHVCCVGVRHRHVLQSMFGITVSRSVALKTHHDSRKPTVISNMH